MNNMFILTPFYPIFHRNDLFEDSKAVYYLINNYNSNFNKVVIHSYMHSYKSSWKMFSSIIPIKKSYNDYKYVDDYGNKILFFQNLQFIPKALKVSNYFNNHYSNLVNQYCLDNKIRIDILVAHLPSYYIDFIPQLKHVEKSIAIIHSFDIKNIKNRYNIDFWKDYYRNFNAIGFRSIVIKNDFEELLNLREKDYQYFYAFSGIPSEYIIDGNLKGYDVYANPVELIFVGSLNKNKNVSVILKALQRIKNSNYHFTIIGDGIEKVNLEKMVYNLGLENKVSFKGLLKRSKTLEYLKQADIFIMLSHKETFGLVYLEAIASGCIVIGTENQGLDGLIINNKNGFLTSPTDLNKITETLFKVITLSPKEQTYITSNAKDLILKLTDEKTSKDYFRSIEKILSDEV